MGEYSSATLDAVFAAVAEPTRRAILARLQHSDALVTQVARDFPVSLNTISKHIKTLERAGLVRRTILGRDHLLSLQAEPLAAAVAWMEHYRGFWQSSLASLDAFVSRRRGTPTPKEKR